MLLDLSLAIAHHLLMFALIVVLVIEMVAIRPGMPAARILRLSRLDLVFGMVAGLILVVGFARVFFGLKGPSFYLDNPVFWAKVGTFLAIGVLSLQPTRRLIAWRAAARGSSDYTPPAAEIRNVRQFMHLEATLFILIPVFAALMARGYGL
jgi:putative membrane protein